MYFLYILQSAIGKKFYIGVTKDIKSRLRQHNNGLSKATKPYQPWQIIYSESHPKKELAYKREWHLKHPVGYLEKLSLIERFAKNYPHGEVA